MMKAVNIIWDVDESEDLDRLPKEVEIPAEIAEDPDYASLEYEDALYDHIADWLSDTFEFCHEGFEIERS